MPRRLMDRLTNRNRGILTQADREFLRGEKELKPQSARKRRQQIRERVWNAIFDFWLLVDHLPDEDWEGIFEQRRVEFNEEYSDIPLPYQFLHEEYRMDVDSPTLAATTAFREALIDMVAFVTEAAMRLTGVETARIIEEGMAKGLRKYGKTADVTLNEVTDDYLRERLEADTFNLGDFWFLLGDHSDVAKEVLGPPSTDAEGPDDHEIPDWMKERYEGQRE